MVLEHTWGHQPEGALSPRFDLVVACDVMYIAEAIPDLVSTLVALCAPRGQVLLAHGRNRGGEAALLAQVCGAALPCKRGVSDLDIKFCNGRPTGQREAAGIYGGGGRSGPNRIYVGDVQIWPQPALLPRLL